VSCRCDPSSQIAEIQAKEIVEAARTLGQRVHVLSASTAEEIEQAFVALVQRGAGALLMSADLFFQVQREQVVGLAARHSLPVMYEWSEFVRAGGLISYSSFRTDAFVQSGVYVGRILNGANPADLPVVQSTKFNGFREFATAGGLMSYAASLPDIYRRLAGVADKILKGARPGELPIERPTKFQLVINLMTAKALGLMIPNSMQLLADEVIE
jgi:ABC-type uncharacterized transport system substrate-binding protein